MKITPEIPAGFEEQITPEIPAGFEEPKIRTEPSDRDKENLRLTACRYHLDPPSDRKIGLNTFGGRSGERLSLRAQTCLLLRICFVSCALSHLIRCETGNRCLKWLNRCVVSMSKPHLAVSHFMRCEIARHRCFVSVSFLHAGASRTRPYRGANASFPFASYPYFGEAHMTARTDERWISIGFCPRGARAVP